MKIESSAGRRLLAGATAAAIGVAGLAGCNSANQAKPTPSASASSQLKEGPTQAASPVVERCTPTQLSSWKVVGLTLSKGKLDSIAEQLGVRPVELAVGETGPADCSPAIVPHRVVVPPSVVVEGIDYGPCAIATKAVAEPQTSVILICD